MPKRLYSYINQGTKRRRNSPGLWGDSNTSLQVEADCGKAHVFSNYFSNLYVVETPFPSVHIIPHHTHTGQYNH